MNYERKFRMLRARAIRCKQWDNKQQLCCRKGRCACMVIARKALAILDAPRDKERTA